MKNLLLKIHRYAALAAAPFVAWLLLTGLVLAFKPVLAPETAAVPLGNQAAQVAQAVARLDAQGVEIQSLAADRGGNVFWATVDGRLWAHDAATGERLYTAGMGDSVFNLFKKLHKSVVPDAEFVSWVLLILMLIGAALLMRPRLRASLLAWHNALGLVLLPVWLMLPLTGILMEAHFGAPDFAKTQQAPGIPAMVRRLDAVGELGNVRELVSIKGGRFLLVKMDTAEGVQTFQINEDGYPAATLGRYWAKELHEGTWAGKVSGWLNVLLAAGILFFVFSGVYSWLRRCRGERRARAAAAGIAVDSGSVLIAYASQTGRAEQLAQATQKALVDAGARAEVLPMSALTAAMMRAARLNVLIASTTGEGELPDAGKALLKQLAGEKLPDTPYALLALGDRAYAHFCGGGEKLQAALQNAAAREILPMARADGTPDAAWQGWLKEVFAHLHLSSGSITAPAATADVPLRLILRKRYPLHDAAYSSREVCALEFEPVGAVQNVEFRGGDLLMIAPPAGHSLAPRSYSIGSDSRYNATLRLTVALHRFRLDNGETATGACSQWLCRDLPEGSEVQAALRAHPSFRLPEDNAPVIMAAAGSGIAPLIGFLPALEKHRRTAWLFFGNAGEKGDFLERERLQNALQNGVLTRLQTVFDDQKRGYVQDLMRANGGELYRLIGEENARIFVCGRSSTIGQGVLQALRDIAAEQGQDGEKWIAELQRNGQLHMDLFG